MGAVNDYISPSTSLVDSTVSFEDSERYTIHYKYYKGYDRYACRYPNIARIMIPFPNPLRGEIKNLQETILKAVLGSLVVAPAGLWNLSLLVQVCRVLSPEIETSPNAKISKDTIGLLAMPIQFPTGFRA